MIIYALTMSTSLGFEIDEIVNDKLEHIAKKYPAELMKQNAQSGSGSDTEYWRIKEEYRKKGNN